jgi:LPXTG-site transpeptidase (sortase) family protein
MQIFSLPCIINEEMRNIKKILVTVIITLSILLPVGYFLIYPRLTELKIKYSQINISRISKETTFALLTTISPYKIPKEEKQILGATTIEESLTNMDIDLDTKILEELEMEIHIDPVDIKGYIYQGKTSETMNQGFWHYPISQYPGEKGNVVVIGHRFQHLPPAKNTFYNLDKLKIGDEVVISHTEGEYKYIVVDMHVIDPTDISVLEETEDYRLTLITCTPLWTSEKRLVITAKLDKLYKKV